MKVVARSLPVLAVALLAGCTAQHSPAPAPTVTVTAAPTPTASPSLSPATATATATVTPPPSAVPATPVEVGPCSDDDLVVTNGAMESADTQRRVLVSFRNSSSHACTMVGYPGADLVTPAGEVLINVPRRPANAAPRLTLQPGEVGTADVLTYAIDTETGNSCARWGQLVVTPPNHFVAHALPVDLPICGASVSALG
jgi:hypothetical protein